MVDGELSTFELRRLLGRIEEEGDASLVATWQRYHLIGAALRGERLPRQGLEIADRVAGALVDEPAPRRRPQSPVWLKPVAGAAIAASVAAVTVLALLPGREGVDSAARVAEKVQTPAENSEAAIARQMLDSGNLDTFAPAGWRARTASTRWHEQPGDSPRIDEQRLNHYLMEHSEFERQYGVGGILPYASFVGHDAR